MTCSTGFGLVGLVVIASWMTVALVRSVMRYMVRCVVVYTVVILVAVVAVVR